MTKKIIVLAGIFILALCLISGGCQPTNQTSSLKSWKDLIDLLPENKPEAETEDPNTAIGPEPPVLSEETIIVNLYFADEEKERLELENREIVKEEGIGRATLEQLFKGPADPLHTAVVPPGTHLLDINVKPEGLCIVNLSSQARQIADSQQEELMVFAIVNTLGQFASVQEVSFMVDGENVDRIGGYMDLSQPTKPDYSK